MTTVKNKTNLDEDVLKLLSEIYSGKKTSLHEPYFIGNEIKYVNDCIKSSYVSSVGSYVSKFEKNLSKFVGVKHAIAVTNGTSALHIALLMSDVRANDEVLMPALNFVAGANAVTYCNAIPHFVDSEYETLGVDAESLDKWLKKISIIKNKQCFNIETGRRIKALMIMHTFGHPSKIKELVKIAKKYYLKIIEDCAESLGSYYLGAHTGSFGNIATLSFNGNKIITTGGGGAILTNSDLIAKKIKHITTTSKKKHPWLFIHDSIGYNYRMPNVNAALGCAQLEKLPYILHKKRQLFKKYKKKFTKISGLHLFEEPKNCNSNYWLNTIILNNNNIKNRDKILKKTNKFGINTRPSWNLTSSLKPFKNCPKSDLEVATSLNNSIINIPSSAFI